MPVLMIARFRSSKWSPKSNRRFSMLRRSLVINFTPTLSRNCFASFCETYPLISEDLAKEPLHQLGHRGTVIGNAWSQGEVEQVTFVVHHPRQLAAEES
jgi:hypothetical protein